MNVQTRPEVSVYWQPGCSSCLRLKEFVEDLGIPFESVNVAATPAALQEIRAAGLRSIPAVRKGDRFSYAQSLDDVAALLGVDRNHAKMSPEQLFRRWVEIMAITRGVVDKFTAEQLVELMIPVRKREIRHVIMHTFLILEGFMRQVDDGVTDTDSIHNSWEVTRPLSQPELLSFIDGIHGRFLAWIGPDRGRELPARLETYYGTQPSIVVLERAVWHCLQHARQIDVVAAGRAGAEFEIYDRADLAERLPIPKRLWS